MKSRLSPRVANMRNSPLRYVRHTLLMALLVIAAGAMGCWSQGDPFDACIAWPAEEACPSDDIAIFYLSALFHGCYRAEAIESKGRKGDNCCYEVTRDYDLACDFGR